MSLFQLLNGNNYGVFNRDIAHEIGLNETLLLSEILDKYSYFKNEGQLINAPGEEGEWFYLKADIIFQRTTLTERQQRPCIEKFIKLGFIKKTSFGLPCLRYFQVNEEVIEEFLISKIKSTRGSKKEGLSLDKITNTASTKCKSSPIYKIPSKETKEENERERGDAGASPLPPPSESIFTFGYVEMKMSEKEMLEKQYGIGLIEDYIERLNDWFSNNLTEHKAKRNDAGRIRNWLKRDGIPKIKPITDKTRNSPILMDHPPRSRPIDNFQWMTTQLEEKGDLQQSGKIVLFRNYVDFPFLPEGKIYYDSEGFKERFENNMRKING